MNDYNKVGNIEILEKIRSRLQIKVDADLHTIGPKTQPEASLSVRIKELQSLHALISSAHNRVGLLNLPTPGFKNHMIHAFKRFMQYILGWHTRPIIEFQYYTICYLGKMAEILDSRQSQLEGIQSKTELLMNDLADLRLNLERKNILPPQSTRSIPDRN